MALADPARRSAVVAGVAWSCSTAINTRPHSYGRVGGRRKSARMELAGSNFDWGQDLHRLAEWRFAHRVPGGLLSYTTGSPCRSGSTSSTAGRPDTFVDTGSNEPRSPAKEPEATLPGHRRNVDSRRSANVHLESGEPFGMLSSPLLTFDNAFARLGRRSTGTSVLFQRAARSFRRGKSRRLRFALASGRSTSSEV